MRNNQSKTVVVLLAFNEYTCPAPESGESQLKSLPYSAEQQSNLRVLFEKEPRFRDAGFEVLDLEPCRNSGDVLARLKQVGDLARKNGDLNVVLIWSGHGQTFDRKLRLATPECTEPLNEASGLPASELVIQTGAKVARNFCVFIDACEAGGAALEFSEVAAARAWNDADQEHTFAAFYASCPFISAKDGTYLSLLTSILDKGPSEEAEKEVQDRGHNIGFRKKYRLLSANEIDQAISAEIIAHPGRYRGLGPSAVTGFGSQFLFPNPRYSINAPVRMVDEEALDTHFLSKARGIEFGLRGWHFTGRVQTTRNILGWATSEPSATASIYILTGGGGTGKSALVGRLVALSDREARERLRIEGWNEEEDQESGTLPSVDLFDAAVHLRNLTAQRVVEQLAVLLRLDRPESPKAFVETIEKQNKTHMRVVFDALDEAEDPGTVASAVILPLAKVGWRVLVATRPSSRARGADDLISLLSSVRVELQDLDADTNSAEDIAQYVTARIRSEQSPQFMDNPSLIKLASTMIAERAKDKFLYARIATSYLLRCVDEISEQTLDGLLGAGINGIFDQDLRELDKSFQTHFKRKDRGASRLLEALAWAQGSGIPIRDGLWGTVTNALASQLQGTFVKIEDTHVNWVLREAGRYILEDGDGDQAVYRLFHQSLIDHFHPNRDTEADRASIIAQSLSTCARNMGGWRHANSYLVRHMASHWAACRPQLELHSLLLDFQWMRARLEGTDIHALLKDYEYVMDPAPQAISVVSRTLSMTAHILWKDKRQLIPQLLGRVPPVDKQLQMLREDARHTIDRLMLLPRLGGLRQAGSLIRVIDIDIPKAYLFNTVAFTLDGNHVVLGGRDGTVWLWDVLGGKTTGEPLRGHGGKVNSVAFSQDGMYVVSGSDDKTLRLWEVASCKEIHVLRGHEGRITCVAFSPDGMQVVSGSDDATLRLWEVRSGQVLGELHWNDHEIGLLSVVLRLVRFVGFTSVAFSLDGNHVIAGGRDGSVRRWDVHSKQAVGDPLWHNSEVSHVIFRGGVSSVAFSSDGMQLASGGGDGALRLWSVSNQQALVEPMLGHSGKVTSVAFRRDGRQMVSGGEDRTVRLWEVESGKELRVFRGHEEGVSSVAFSLDGTYVVSGGDDGTVRLWDIHGEQVRDDLLRGHDGEVTCVAFSPDGTYLISGSDDRSVRLWDVHSGQVLGEPLRYDRERSLLSGLVRVGGISSVAFNSDGTCVVAGGRDGTVWLWEVHSGLLVAEPLRYDDKLRGSFVGRGISSVAFNLDGTYVVSGNDDGTLRLWEVSSGNELHVLQGHEGGVSSVAFSPDGTKMVSGGCDGTVRLWEVASKKALHVFRGHEGRIISVTFSSDGMLVSSGSDDGTVRLWEVLSGKELHVLRGHERGISSMTFSPDGMYVISGSSDGAVQLWDVAAGQSVGIVRLDAAILAVAVSSLPIRVVAGLKTGQVIFLDLDECSNHSEASTIV